MNIKTRLLPENDSCTAWCSSQGRCIFLTSLLITCQPFSQYGPLIFLPLTSHLYDGDLRTQPFFSFFYCLLALEMSSFSMYPLTFAPALSPDRSEAETYLLPTILDRQVVGAFVQIKFETKANGTRNFFLQFCSSICAYRLSWFYFDLKKCAMPSKKKGVACSTPVDDT